MNYMNNSMNINNINPINVNNINNPQKKKNFLHLDVNHNNNQNNELSSSSYTIMNISKSNVQGMRDDVTLMQKIKNKKKIKKDRKSGEQGKSED